MTVVSYSVKIKNTVKCLDPTIRVYRHAVRYLTDIAFLHYEDIRNMRALEAQSYIERLVHSTKNNKAAYPAFDKRFYKFPSYLRRDAISTAIGKVKAYMTLVQLWKQNQCKGRRPRMNFNQDMMPCFYRGGMFTEKNGSFFIKVYHKNDWVWLPVKLRKTDLDYISRNCTAFEECAPVLKKINHGYVLQFAYKLPPCKNTFLKDKDVTRVVGCDLGLNSDAVCVSMDKDGTVTGTRFIKSPVEKDRLDHILKEIKSAQQKGSRGMHRLWRFADNYNRHIAIEAARQIVAYAKDQGAQVIVFENLNDLKGGSQKISLWRKRDIQHRAEVMASRYGIRTAYVCPKNTSRLAYDGSGPVVRDPHNYSLCTFTTGKKYNCDLSAAKNIAARYFIRVVVKNMNPGQYMQALAKVPELCRRTDCTLSTLISLYAEPLASAIVC